MERMLANEKMMDSSVSELGLYITRDTASQCSYRRGSSKISGFMGFKPEVEEWNFEPKVE